MKIFKLCTALTLLFGTSLAFAQSEELPFLVVPNQTGTTTTAGQTFTVNYTAASGSGGFDFTLNVSPPTGITITGATASIPNATTSCSVGMMGASVNCISNALSSSTDLGNGTITVTYTGGSTAGAVALNFGSSNFFDQVGGPQAGTTTNGTLTLSGAPSPVAPTVTITGPVNLTGSGTATGSVNPNVASGSEGTTGGQTRLTCSIATPGPGSIAITGGATRTIIAPATAGAQNPAIAFSCTPQAMPDTQAMTCVYETSTDSGTNFTTGTPISVNVTCPVATAGGVSPTINNITGTTLSTVSGANRTGTVTIDVATTGSATADLTVNCSIPADSAGFAVTAGVSRTINAPATVGANAPAVGLQCTPQSTLQTATLTCTRTASDGTTPGDTTATITCPAASSGTATPTATNLNLTGASGSTAGGNVTLGNTGTASYNVTGCTASSGYTIGSITFPQSVPPSATVTVPVSCTPGTSASTGTLTCNHDAGGGGTVTGNLTCSVAAPGPAPAVAVPTMGTAAKVLMALLMLGFGLVGFQLYRRSA